jgi:hypothetical protein
LIKKTKILPFSLVIFLSSILLIGIISSPSYAYAQQPQQSSNQRLPPSIIAASTTDTTPHALNLKATQQGEDGQPKKISGFKIDLTNVVTAQINSQVLVFATDSSLQVTGAKIRTVSGQLIDLVPLTTTQANAFSIAGLPPGVYTLDIITQKGNTKAAYEGILVISQQPTTVINETTKNVINQEINQNTRVDTDFKVVFRERDRDNDDGNDKDGNKKTNWRENPDCWYHGKFICDNEGNCDSDKFDCWSDCEDGSTATTGMCPGDDDPKCIDDGRYVCKEVEDEDETKENLIDYEDGCPPGSANPEEGCTLEGYQCGPDGCGYYSHGVCETCTNEVGSSQVDPCDENPQSAECQPEDPCIENPDAEGCPQPPDPCELNPDAEGCQEPMPPIDSCEENPSLPECEEDTAFAGEEPIAEGDNEGGDGEGGDGEGGDGEGGDGEGGDGEGGDGEGGGN